MIHVPTHNISYLTSGIGNRPKQTHLINIHCKSSVLTIRVNYIQVSCHNNYYYIILINN